MTRRPLAQERAEANARAAPGRAPDPFDDDIEDSADTPLQAGEPLGPDDLPFNPYKGNRGFTRAWHAMKHSIAGVRIAIREETRSGRS